MILKIYEEKNKNFFGKVYIRHIHTHENIKCENIIHQMFDGF